MPRKNRERRREYARNYMRKYTKRNLEKTRAQARKRMVKYRQKLRDAVIQRLGGRCAKCDIKDIRVLQIDHIHGGGAEERKTINNALEIYRKIRDMENPESEYQLLCANHNWIKRWENKEYIQYKNRG